MNYSLCLLGIYTSIPYIYIYNNLYIVYIIYYNNTTFVLVMSRSIWIIVVVNRHKKLMYVAYCVWWMLRFWDFEIDLLNHIYARKRGLREPERNILYREQHFPPVFIILQLYIGYMNIIYIPTYLLRI